MGFLRGVEPQIRQSVEEGVERNGRLHPCQMRAGAKVRPEAEGDMILGPPAQIEAVREYARVAKILYDLRLPPELPWAERR